MMPVLREGKPERVFNLCKPPRWADEEGVQWEEDEYGISHHWMEPKEPPGTYWICDKCGNVFIARSSGWDSDEYMTRKERRKARKLKREYIERKHPRMNGAYRSASFMGHLPKKPPVPPKGGSGVSRQRTPPQGGGGEGG